MTGILCCLALAVVVSVLAWVKLCKAYYGRWFNNNAKPVCAEVDGVPSAEEGPAGDAKHANQKRTLQRRTRLNADVVVDVLRLSSPDGIDACRLTSRHLNSIVTSSRNSLPLRSIDFVHITAHSRWSWLAKIRCHTQARRRSSAKSFRDFVLSEMRFALRNCHARRLRIDDPRGHAIQELEGFTEEERCHVEELEISLMGIEDFMELVDEEAIWRAVSALSPSRVHCAFDPFERGYKCLRSPGFMNAERIVVEGHMRATERVLRYVTTERRGPLCWLSNEKNPEDGHYFVNAIIEMFQAQSEIGSFAHVLFLQFPYLPSRSCSDAWCLENRLGLAPIEADLDFNNIAQFYPDPKTTFDKHVKYGSDEFKTFVIENASGQRIFVVASDHNASMMDGSYWLQRVAFVPYLAILGD